MTHFPMYLGTKGAVREPVPDVAHHPEWQLDTLVFLKIHLRASWYHKCLNTQGNSVRSGSPKSCKRHQQGEKDGTSIICQ